MLDESGEEGFRGLLENGFPAFFQVCLGGEKCLGLELDGEASGGEVFF